MKKTFLLILLLAQTLFPQSQNKLNLGIEFTTMVFANDIKVYSDFNMMKSNYIAFTFQPGAELLYGQGSVEVFILEQSPYYDLNFLGTVQLLPDADVSLKAFAGPLFRFSRKDNPVSVDVKFGAALQFQVYRAFSIIFKVMNYTLKKDAEVPVIAGVGFNFNIL